MTNKIQYVFNEITKGDIKGCLNILKKDEVEKAKKFHNSFPQYKETPLAKLDTLAKNIGLGGIYVKDESYRFGLNAFKVLGGSFAMGKYLASKLNEDISNLNYERLTSKEIKDKLGDITFYTATDGNHGRGVAWTANKLNQKSVIYMPHGSSEIRLKNIRKEGAEASITDMNYDDAVRLATKNAMETGGVVIQDTAWEGYEEIPTWIMQGYGTMALEAIEQLKKYDVDRPTHIFLQAGVGSLAGAIQGVFASIYGEKCPITVIAESDLADCIYKSALAKDGKPRFVGGTMETIMAGLACGEPNTIGWEVLRNHSSAFLSCPDWTAANGMRILGNPLDGDDFVKSGESGAVTTGVLYEIMTNDEYKELREGLKLNSDSKVLLFSTEGDTDPKKYREIVWFGNCVK
ncbi:MAG: diaminopropionate ammonia-lyase [Cetobacterium sp.]